MSKFKTLRHIETVRNYIGFVVTVLLMKAEKHDQSKLQPPEAEIFEKYTPKLKGSTYGSDEYKATMKEMKVAIDHHNANNPHHPEHFTNGINDMTLVDLLEMICDWKAASLRHADGDIFKSIEINQGRFGYSDQVKAILVNTANLFESSKIYHHAEES